jgi:tetratricopeptide (TPR) repeat protein
MLDSFWISYMLILLLSFAQRPAYGVDSSTEMMKRASTITSSLNKKNAPCPGDPPFCPRFLNEVIRDDKADGYFFDFNVLGLKELNVKAGKMLDSRFASCIQGVDAKGSFVRQNFPNAKQLQTYIQQNEFSQMGIHIHQAIQGCIAQAQPEDFNKAAKYYYVMGRLDRGVQDVQNELSRIDQILGDQNSLKKCDSTFMDANIQCGSLMKCERKAGVFDAVVTQAQKDEVRYKVNLDAVQKLRGSCLVQRESYKKYEKEIQTKGHFELCDSLASMDGAGNVPCDKLTGDGLKEIKSCEAKEKAAVAEMALLEKTNPWFADENYFKDRKKGQKARDLISQYLQKSRKALQNLQKDFEKSARCLNGTEYRGCDVDQLRETLANTRELPSTYTKSKDHNAFENYMGAQRCIEEGANDRNETAGILRTSGRDATLTVLTAGIGDLVFGGAKLLGQGAQAYRLATNVGEVTNLLVSAGYFAEALGKAVTSCLIEYDKQKLALNGVDSNLTCPDPMAERVAAQKAAESCAGASLETAMNALPFAPLVAKATRKVVHTATDEIYEPSGWVDHSKRSSEPTHHKTPDSPRPAARADFIDKNLNKEFASVEQNEKWIQIADTAKADGQTKFYEIENSVMKELNDVTQDKNFVTAVTNKHKETLLKNIDEVKAKYPDAEVFVYSDFKSVRLAIRPKPPATKLPADVEKAVQEAFQKANKEFAAYMKENQFLREGDQPEKWFRAGSGDTADQASLSARYSRKAAGPNSMRNFKDGDLQENLNTALKATEMYRSQIQNEIGNTGLMSYVPGSTKKTLNIEVFDAIRKTKTPQELMSSLKKSTGVELTEAQAMHLRDYSELVDEFSPSIRIAKRQVASLSDSAPGGFSLDFAGMGARNAQGTADALANSKNLNDALQASRKGETEVTAVFRDKKEKVSSTINSILKKYKITAEIVDSGDDMVIRPNKAIPEKARQEITDALATVISPSDVRMSHVAAYVGKESDRALMGTHGETLEKLTRKNLQGEIPPERLRQILLMTDMKGNAAGQGTVDLVTGSGSVQLNDIERQKIKRAFRKAIDSLNQELKKENEIGNYKTGT